MSIIYFPSCKFTAKYPGVSAKIKTYLGARHNAQIAGCCKAHLKKVVADDQIVYICNTCAAFSCESTPAAVTSLWELLLADGSFAYPDYSGRQVTVQDCWRSSDRREQQDAVRQILQRMNITVHELADNYSSTRFCGYSLYDPLPAGYDKLAPKRLVSEAQGLFIPHTQEEKVALMQQHCEQIRTEEAVCYCVSCVNGIEMGGKVATHLAELVFGTE